MENALQIGRAGALNSQGYAALRKSSEVVHVLREGSSARRDTVYAQDSVLRLQPGGFGRRAGDNLHDYRHAIRLIGPQHSADAAREVRPGKA